MNPGESPGSDWRYVMAANWDPSQNINHVTHRVEWPTGPLGLSSGEIPKWVEAWVMQSSTGASQRTVQWTGWAPTGTTWTADGITPGWIYGQFQAGPALGIALLAYDSSGTDKFYWWLEIVDLY